MIHIKISKDIPFKINNFFHLNNLFKAKLIFLFVLAIFILINNNILFKSNNSSIINNTTYKKNILDDK